MDYTYDVFVSVAGPDLPLARDLCRLLEAAHLKPWLYEEKNTFGVNVHAALKAAIEASQHAIVLLSRNWMERTATEWELQVFDGFHTQARCVVPLNIDHLAKIDTPIELGGRWIAEYDAAGDPERRVLRSLLWPIWCALRGEDPGPREEWDKKTGDLIGNGPVQLGGTLAPSLAAERASRIVATRPAHPVLRLDRTSQWAEVGKLVCKPEHQAWFVFGDRRQAQPMFLRRLQRCLPKTCERTLLPVRWGPRAPVTQAEYAEALASALGVGADRLVEALRARLSGADLVLLHQPPFESAFDNEGLLAYYTKWIPEWLEEVDPKPIPDDRIGCLRTVQTLGWLRPGLMSGVISTLRRVGIDSASLRRATERQAARDFLARAGKNAHWRLPIFLLPELQDLTEQDIRTWALEVMPSADEGERLARHLTGDDLDTAAIFERAAEALGSVGGLDDG